MGVWEFFSGVLQSTPGKNKSHKAPEKATWGLALPRAPENGFGEKASTRISRGILQFTPHSGMQVVMVGHVSDGGTKCEETETETEPETKEVKLSTFF